MRPHLFLFSLNKLIANYTHIGFKQHLTNQYFRKALVGSYSGVAIIDPTRTLSHLRFFSKFIINLLITNQKLCLVAYSVPRIFTRNLHLYGNFFIYNNWSAGLLTNFRRVVCSEKVKAHGFFKYIPATIILFDLPPQKALEVINEAKGLLIPVFSFVDSNIDLSLYPYWVPANLKSGHSRRFLLNYIGAVFARSVLIKKYLFFKRAHRILKSIHRSRRLKFKMNLKIMKMRKSKKIIKNRKRKKNKNARKV